jgi:flavodoxin I
MASIGIFFGSTGGNTENAAEAIAKHLGECKLCDVAKAGAADLARYDRLILGTSTWGEGELQDDWERFLQKTDSIDLSGKTVALFGLGDQEGYDEYFVDGMGILCEWVAARGGRVIGSWPVAGYQFEHSRAVKEGAFVGLALDEDNQDDLTDERITQWTAQLQKEW